MSGSTQTKIATPRYTVTFARYEPPEEFDVQKSKAIVGEAELLRFLYVINIDADDLKTDHACYASVGTSNSLMSFFPMSGLRTSI